MTLPQSKKDVYRTRILLRDGIDCLYCKKRLITDDLDFDHLDNNDKNNKIENIVLTHHRCNCEKRTNSDYQIIAREKLEQNKKNPLYMGEIEKQLEDPDGRQEQSLEMKVRTDTYQITKQWLHEHIVTDGELDYRDTIDSLVFYCMEKTGHGSQKVIQSHIAALCSTVGNFMIIKDKKIKKIVKRTGN